MSRTWQPLTTRFVSAQLSSRCLVDDWLHARSRRAGPLHRWLVDDAAAAELPAVIAWSELAGEGRRGRGVGAVITPENNARDWGI
jgi:hypothetical protein